MNYFPSGNEEITLLKFIAKFQYLNTNDTKYFFKSKAYYKKRITHLAEIKYLKRVKYDLVLDEVGISYVKQNNFQYNTRNRNKKYLPRLQYISHLAAMFYNSKTIKYTPSFSIKDKEIFTTTARKYIGILEISGIEYLTYHITSKHDNKYILSVIYDIQKEHKYRNTIVLVNNLNRININDFTFGNNQVLLIEDSDINREKLEYLHRIDWQKIINNYYNNKVFLAGYNFCDYTDYKTKFILTFSFLDTEKINRVKYFLRENKNKTIDIFCPREIEYYIRKELPNANYTIIDLEDYIVKEINIYD
ncbi:MAG: hypothetical protein IJH39_00465 [Clostridia bacterium]|nr:hypothetical protein [Clostridia bacterium]